LPSALFEYGPVAQMDQSACLRNRRSQVQVLPGSLGEFRIADCGFRIPCFQDSPSIRDLYSRMLRWSSWYDSGPVNRQRWFESSTKLLQVQGSGFRVQGSGFRLGILNQSLVGLAAMTSVFQT